MNEKLTFRHENRVLHPVAPYRDRALNSKDSILEYQASRVLPENSCTNSLDPQMRVDIAPKLKRVHNPVAPMRDKKRAVTKESLPKKIFDISGKTRDLYENRRKFLSRGFIASGILLAGSARSSRSATELSITHYEEIQKTVMDTPHYISKTPGYIQSVGEEIIDFSQKSPTYIREAAEFAQETPSYIKEGAEAIVEKKDEIPEFIANQYAEVKKTNIDFERCTLKEKERRYFNIDIPYVDPDIDDPICVEEFNARMPELMQTEAEKKDPKIQQATKQKKAKNEAKNLGIGVGLALVGAAILAKEKDRPLTRRNLLNKIRSGIEYGLIWHVLYSDENPLKEKLKEYRE